jgi:hypothetical protein
MDGGRGVTERVVQPGDMRRGSGGSVALFLTLVLLLGSSAAAQALPVPSTSNRATPWEGPSESTPQVLILVSSLNTIVPASVTVWGLNAQIVLTNNDTEIHDIAFSSRVNQSVPSTTSASNSSGSWFAWPNLLADQTVSASSTIEFPITFPSPGTYQFVDRAYFNTPYQTGGNFTVNSVSSPAPSGSAAAGGNNYVYPGARLGGGLLVGVAVTAIILRKRRRGPGVARSEP